MPSSISHAKGFSRHQHFGLRLEWLAGAIANWESWVSSTTLGTRQVQALRTWIRTIGLADGEIGAALCRAFARDLSSLMAWQVSWVYMAFGFPLVRWYVCDLGLGSWNTRELRTALQDAVPHLACATIQNAIMELVGTLEHTPLGSELRQGRVLSTRPRTVIREGFLPDPRVAIYALYRLQQQTGARQLSLAMPALWPWTIFGCNPENVIIALDSAASRWFSIGLSTIRFYFPPEAWKDDMLRFVFDH